MKIKNSTGSTALILVLIVVLGIVIGGGIYLISKNVGGKGEVIPTTPATTGEEAEAGEGAGTTGSGGLNFSKKGTLLSREGGWVFLWDEPGRLAANVKLTFTNQSTCLFGGQEVDCDSLNNGPETYDYVGLEGNQTNGEVTVLRLEELELPQ
jgi:hypothetical protein